MNQEELTKILDDHGKWLVGDGGEKADLRGADLRGADMSGADMRWANLREADMRGANLRWADLCGADLRGADLCVADMSEANMRGADMCGADMSEANLREANLYGADMREADMRGVKYIPDLAAAQLLSCPEHGSFVGWKKCQYDVIVKLLIPAEAKRSSATTRKCRAEFVDVLEVIGADAAMSAHDYGKTVYRVGERVHCNNWDDDRWNECSGGIHFFITRAEAENY